MNMSKVKKEDLFLFVLEMILTTWFLDRKAPPLIDLLVLKQMLGIKFQLQCIRVGIFPVFISMLSFYSCVFCTKNRKKVLVNFYSSRYFCML